MSFQSDGRLEQLLQAEKVQLFQTLDELMNRYHLRMSHSIRDLIATIMQKKESPDVTQQSDYALAGAHISDMRAWSLSYAPEVPSKPVSRWVKRSTYGNEVQDLDVEPDVPNERAMVYAVEPDRPHEHLLGYEVEPDVPNERLMGCELQNFHTQTYGMPHEPEAGATHMEQSMESSSQECTRQDLLAPSRLVSHQKSFCSITASATLNQALQSEQDGTKNRVSFRDFFHSSEKGESVSRIRRLVEGTTFDVITSILVVMCCVMMAVEIQYDGLQAGFVLKSGGFTKPASQVWPHAKMVLSVSDLVFNMLFTIELVIRLVALRKDALRSCWFYVDTLLVALSWLSEFKAVTVGLNPMLLRLARLARLGRVMKLLRNAQVVQTLFLLVRSIQASIGCLIWSFTIIWFFQIIMAILMVQLLHPLMIDESRNIDSRREVFKYFGTFVRGSLTMFEITMANWTPVVRLLYEDVNELYAVLFVAYRCCFMFAILRVITAVFIAETARCASTDDELAIQKKQIQKESYCSKLTDAFKHLDINGDGVISWDEFEPLISNPLLKTWLSTLDIDTHDLMALFKIYDKGDRQFNMKLFIEGLSHVKGPAKSIDVLKLLTNVDVLNKKMDKILRNNYTHGLST